jgi:hypothetical protein
VELGSNHQAAVERLAKRLNEPSDEVLRTPGRLAGSAEAIVDQLLCWREQLDVTYFTFSQNVMESMAPVVARLAGT